MSKSIRTLIIAGTVTAAFALGAVFTAPTPDDSVACGEGKTKKDEKKDDKRS